eukprot:gene16425-22396_t
MSIPISQQIPGTLSCISSLCVILTYIVFPDLRRLRYIELVTYVALNNLIASSGIALGPATSKSQSFVCWYQGFTTNFNYLSSVLWTVIITYQVWLVSYNGKVLSNLSWIHGVCWGLPLLVSLLPLTTNTYGKVDENSVWCSISNRSDSPKYGEIFWVIFSFYIWLWISVFITILLLVSITFKLRRMAIIPQLIRKTVYKLIIYPIILIICWTTASVAAIVNAANSHNKHESYDTNRGAVVLAVLQGFLITVAFFILNPFIRYKWKMLICQYIPCLKCLLDNICIGSIDINNNTNSSVNISNNDKVYSIGSVNIHSSNGSINNNNNNNNSNINNIFRTNRDDSTNSMASISNQLNTSSNNSSINNNNMFLENEEDYIPPSSTSIGRNQHESWMFIGNINSLEKFGSALGLATNLMTTDNNDQNNNNINNNNINNNNNNININNNKQLSSSGSLGWDYFSNKSRSSWRESGSNSGSLSRTITVNSHNSANNRTLSTSTNTMSPTLSPPNSNYNNDMIDNPMNNNL